MCKIPWRALGCKASWGETFKVIQTMNVRRRHLRSTRHSRCRRLLCFRQNVFPVKQFRLPPTTLFPVDWRGGSKLLGWVLTLQMEEGQQHPLTGSRVQASLPILGANPRTCRSLKGWKTPEHQAGIRHTENAKRERCRAASVIGRKDGVRHTKRLIFIDDGSPIRAGARERVP